MKPIWQSKTMLANAVMAILAAAELNIGLLRPVLGESAHGVISFASIIVNVGLRFMTTQPVSLSGK